MKLKTILYFMIFFSLLEAREPSPIPLPKTEVLSRSSYECADSCLMKYIERGDIFSFLSYAKNELENSELEEKRRFFQTLLNVSGDVEEAFVRIALLLPDKKIGRYALSVSKSTFAYLIARKVPFEVKSYFIEDETNSTLAKAIEEIEADEHSFVIAPLTERGVHILSKIETKPYIYIPTTHIRKIENKSENLIFGGIDYKKQVEELLSFLDVNDSLSMFFDDSQKGEELRELVLETLQNKGRNIDLKVDERVEKKQSNFKKLLNKDEVGGKYFINTTQLKSSILLSQLTANKQKPALILSTQINYSPNLLSMTQYRDRKNMLIANSISGRDNRDILNMNLLLNNDIRYNWINYSTTVGVDYFFSLITGKKREFQELLINNQIIYNIRIMKPQQASFVEIEKRN
jgi:5S rRNA maturation endonuclease (ribonuclease M5)